MYDDDGTATDDENATKEKDILKGKVTDSKSLKQELKSWRK